MKIGLVGIGIIGDAFYQNMKHVYDIVRYDSNKKYDVESINELVLSVNGPIFVSVPTPMNQDGSCHIGIVDSVCKEINEAIITKSTECNHTDYKQIVVIRSTVVPGTTEKLNNKYHNLSIVFNPEFLTENNSLEDFQRQTRIIVGGCKEATKIVASLYHVVFPYVKIQECSSVVAELTKYVTNCFLATKVAFANEIFQICEALKTNYHEVIELATLDPRLGKSHWKVSTERGFAGKCFPKDLNALISIAYDNNVDPKVMKATWEKNLEVRLIKDWL